VKSDRSAEVLHHFGLGRTIGFQAAVSDTSGGKHPESSHQLLSTAPNPPHSAAAVDRWDRQTDRQTD